MSSVFFIPMKVYKHEMFRDIAFLIRSSEIVTNVTNTNHTNDRHRLNVFILNVVNPENVYVLQEWEVDIENKDLPKWREIYVTLP